MLPAGSLGSRLLRMYKDRQRSCRVGAVDFRSLSGRRGGKPTRPEANDYPCTRLRPPSDISVLPAVVLTLETRKCGGDCGAHAGLAHEAPSRTFQGGQMRKEVRSVDLTTPCMRVRARPGIAGGFRPTEGTNGNGNVGKGNDKYILVCLTTATFHPGLHLLRISE